TRLRHPSHPPRAPPPLHDALPIWRPAVSDRDRSVPESTWDPEAAAPESPRRPAASPYQQAPFPPTTAPGVRSRIRRSVQRDRLRSEEHTSELQSRVELVCRLLLEQ